MTLTRRFMVSLLLTVAATAQANAANQDTDAPRNGLAIIGASATAGWGVVVPVLYPSEGNRFLHVHLGDALRVVDPDLPKAVTPSGSPGFFRLSMKARERLVDSAIAAHPEIVSAIDFLFWYAYGSIQKDGIRTETQIRASRLEQGLAQLDRIATLGVPVIVGDLPDVNDALDAKPFSFLSRRQVPTAAMLKPMNERILAWAKTHDNVHLLQLGTLVGEMKAGKQVHAGGVPWGPEPRLMQHDRLHPSLEGLLALAAATAEQIQKAQGRTVQMIDKEAVRRTIRIKDSSVPSAP